jgi:hypothetical protein
MGTYLTTPSHHSQVKVSGFLAEAVDLPHRPCGSISANDLLTLLADAECALLSSPQWHDLVFSGRKHQLDQACATVGVSCVGTDSSTFVWFEQRKLQAAREVARSAAAADDLVYWS